MKIPLVINLDPRGLKNQLSKDEMLDFICEMDLSYAEVDFTTNLIGRLVESVKGDLISGSEKEELLREIRDILNK